MSAAAALAGLAAAISVPAAWNALAAAEHARLGASLARALAPLGRAAREGRDPSPPERRRLALLATGGLLAFGWVLGGPLAGGALATAGPWLAWALVRGRRRRYADELARGAPHLARALSDALAGGHSIRGAVVEAARGGGVPGPAGRDLAAAARALELGAPTEIVLERLRATGGRRPDTSGSRALGSIVAAILLQRRAGGELSRLLREVAAAVEDALRLEADARTATAQARFTALLVCLLPVAAAGLAELGSPGYLGSLGRSPLSAWLAGVAALLQAAALLSIQRIARVRG